MIFWRWIKRALLRRRMFLVVRMPLREQEAMARRKAAEGARI